MKDISISAGIADPCVPLGAMGFLDCEIARPQGESGFLAQDPRNDRRKIGYFPTKILNRIIIILIGNPLSGGRTHGRASAQPGSVPRDREETHLRRGDRLARLVPQRSGRDLGAAGPLRLWAALRECARRVSTRRVATRLYRAGRLSDLRVVERLEGNATTDFGAPDAVPSSDLRPVDESQLKRWQAILTACWAAFDAAALAAAGKELRKGPRGGGRELEGIVRHVQGAGEAYLGKLGWKAHSEARRATCSRR